MLSTTLSFANMHEYGELFANVLRARKASFILRNKWDLPEEMGMEYDQYDTPASRWVAVHDNGTVFAGMRLTPTTARCGVYSYMIRDAQLGLLETIPQTLLYNTAPVEKTVWEFSRGFVCNSTPQSIRRRVHGYMFHQLKVSAYELGARNIIGLVPANWPRWAPRCKLKASAAGPTMLLDEINYQCVTIDVTDTTQ